MAFTANPNQLMSSVYSVITLNPTVTEIPEMTRIVLLKSVISMPGNTYFEDNIQKFGVKC